MGSKLLEIAKMGDLVVGGTSKDPDELRFEELWMKRIEILESQYDHHVNLLEKRLIDGKINKRLVTTLQEQNSRLKGEVSELTTQAGKFQSKFQVLQDDFQKKEAEERKLKADLEANKAEIKRQRLLLKEKEDLAKTAKREEEVSKRRFLIGQRSVEKLETVVDQLEQDLAMSKAELETVEKQSHQLAVSLKKAEDEKQRINKENDAALNSIAFHRRERETDEEQMLRLNRELKDIVQQLKSEKKSSTEKERQLQLSEKNLEEVRDELKNLLSKVTSTALETRYWKEEAEMLMKAVATVPQPPSSFKSKIEQRQKVRSDKAELNYRINTLEKRLAEMESEKIWLTNQIKSMTTLHKSLFRLYQKNMKERKAIEERTGLIRPQRKHGHQKNLLSNSKIGKQEKKLEVLENELFKSRRASNFLRFKLLQKSELERNLGHAERSLLRVERERRECEAVANQAARKLGSRFETSLLMKNLLSEIEFAKEMRDKLPPLFSPKEKESRKLGSDLDTDLTDIGKELRSLERKQAVYKNIQAAKERLKQESVLLNAEKAAEEDNSQEALSSSSSDSEPAENSPSHSIKSESVAEEKLIN